jgi:hypothetical protein
MDSEKDGGEDVGSSPAEDPERVVCGCLDALEKEFAALAEGNLGADMP